MGSSGWGPWRLSNDGRFLQYRSDGSGQDPAQESAHESAHESALSRRLDLYRCTTAAEVLDTIFHEAGAAVAVAVAVAVADDAYLAGLVRALDELLHPMAHLCSGGKPRTLSRKALIDILDRGGAR